LATAAGYLAFIAEAVAMLLRADEHVGNGFDPSMRMPGKSREVIFRVLIAEVVKWQERTDIIGFAEAEGAVKFYAGTRKRGAWFT
jgi:hypothetical protein